MPRQTGQQQLAIVPLSLKQAAAVVDQIHRHHQKPQGHKFSLGVQDETGSMRGVAIIGRPVARCFDDGLTAEVTRVATDGAPNACSALYGAAWRTASAAGYRRIITYTQDGESGASLRAVGWRLVAELSPRKGWSVPSRPREDRGTDNVARQLWEQSRASAGPLPSIADLRNEIRNEILCEAVGCGRPFPIRAGRGRPAHYCSPACRLRAHRQRAKAVA
ncbi:XF1762 family protein [Streptomyces bangladeshensis]|uniref:Zinc finger CGNR domain-containing protein n=1 Tax=Streptomyces bangladeshensis TaxID=295352 RepID=A0ABN3BSY2_9ACTN